MSQAYFVINSNDRNKALYSNPADYRVVSTNYNFSAKDIAGLAGTEFSMKFDIPNINARNGKMIIDDGVSSYPIVIDDGFYDEAALAGLVQTQLIVALGAGQFCNWNSLKQRFVILTNVPIKITDLTGLSRDLADVMGFIKEGDLNITNTGGSSDLVYTRNIYLKSNTLHKNKTLQDQSTSPILTDLLMAIPVYQPGADTSKPQIISYQVTEPKRIHYNKGDSITSFDMQLLDDQGEPLYNPDTGDNSWYYHASILAYKY